MRAPKSDSRVVRLLESTLHGHSRRGTLVSAVVVLAVGVLVVGVVRSHRQNLAHHAESFTFGAGLRADLFLPDPLPVRAPVVVIVPGGGWTSAHAGGLAPLADHLASMGVVAVTATYRTGSDSSRFPVPVADVMCAVDTAAAKARTAGVEPSRIVVAGHSAGAQLAALAALAGTRFRGACDAPQVQIGGLVGLAGPYDIGQLSDLAKPLLGTTPGADPGRWRQANPLNWVDQRRDLPVLLASGTADNLVSPYFTNTFADALRHAGHQVKVSLVEGATHATIYRANVTGDAIAEWVLGLG